jgi:hypothetical protein
MFWPLQLNFKVSRVPKDSQVPILQVWVSSSHSLKVGLWHFLLVVVLYIIHVAMNLDLETVMMAKSMKKGAKKCGKFVKNVFWIFEKSPWEHFLPKKLFNFWNKFLYFQSCNYKSWNKLQLYFHENSSCFKIPFIYMFKALKKSMWIGGFLFWKFFS